MHSIKYFAIFNVSHEFCLNICAINMFLNNTILLNTHVLCHGWFPPFQSAAAELLSLDPVEWLASSFCHLSMIWRSKNERPMQLSIQPLCRRPRVKSEKKNTEIKLMSLLQEMTTWTSMMEFKCQAFCCFVDSVFSSILIHSMKIRVTIY